MNGSTTNGSEYGSFLSGVRESAFSRRTVLQGAGVGASVLALAACSSPAAVKPKAGVDISSTQKSLRFDGRDTYRNTIGEDFPLLAKFTDATGIKVTYSGAVSEDNLFFAKVKKQLAAGEDIGDDAAVLSDWMAARWIRLGYVQPFDRAKITNFNNIRLLFQDASYDSGRHFSLPWSSGFTGIAWNKTVLPSGFSTVSDLWNPVFAGKVGVLSSMRDTVGLIMMDAGVDISSDSWGDPEFNAAIETLRKQVTSKQILSIKGNQYKEDLKSGKTLAAIARVGDIMQINAEAGDQWGFAIPAKGGVLWNDVVIVPIGSAHRTNVEEFLNFYYDRPNAAQVAADTNFISPVDVRQPEIKDIPQDKARNLMIFPSEATFKTVKSFRTLTQAEEQRYGALYQGVLLAGA